jgi:hypothetical protein
VLAQSRSWIAALLLVLVAAPGLASAHGAAGASCCACPQAAQGDAQPCRSLAAMSCCDSGATFSPAPAQASLHVPCAAGAAALPAPRAAAGVRLGLSARDLPALISALRLSVVLQT